MFGQNIYVSEFTKMVSGLTNSRLELTKTGDGPTNPTAGFTKTLAEATQAGARPTKPVAAVTGTDAADAGGVADKAGFGAEAVQAIPEFPLPQINGLICSYIN